MSSLFKKLTKLADPIDIFGGSDTFTTLLDPLKLLGGKEEGQPEQVATPQPAAADTLMTPTVMPTADSDAQRAARRKSQADQAKRRGRQATILTGNDDSLGVTG